MIITSKVRREYIPEAYGNKKLPPEDQIRVILDHPNSEEWEAYSTARGFAGTRIIKDRVKSITNLTVDEKQILTGEDLVTVPRRADVHDLVSELVLVFLNGRGLTEDQEKNSDAPPSSP